jgi:predicted RNA-binding protein with PIN domain
MSLRYIIDGCNIINHPRFIRSIPKRAKPVKTALLDFINQHKLCGSLNNKITIVFDGYPDRYCHKEDKFADIIFSRSHTADEKIKEILEGSPFPKSIIVVSDDKQVKFFAQACGARAIGVEEFIPLKDKAVRRQDDLTRIELTYAQMHKINEELKRIWLK